MFVGAWSVSSPYHKKKTHQHARDQARTTTGGSVENSIFVGRTEVGITLNIYGSAGWQLIPEYGKVKRLPFVTSLPKRGEKKI